MKKTNINLNWEFINGERSNIPGMPQQKKAVNLPHDFMVENDVTPEAAGKAEAGFYKGTAGTYLKKIILKEDELTDTMLLQFEGCAGKTRVYVNGNPAGNHRYAYTPFDIDIRPFVKAGDNEIMVVVHNDDDPNGRWYMGSGLYRGANLLTAPALHIANDGIFVYTDHITNGDAFCKAEITVVNDMPKATCGSEALIALTVRNKSNGEIAAERLQKIYIKAGQTKVIPQGFIVENADLWSPEDPALYTVEVRLALTAANTVHMSIDNRDGLAERADYIDSIESTFGIRTITADVKNGLQINGKTYKLKGGCIHHDNGILGAESYYDAEYRKVKLHRDNGYNALRLAHNPQSTMILDICDELGMIVYDEAFDVWNLPKNSFDFSNSFVQDGIKELQTMIRRDRNHPSVVFWSIGNELTEQGGMMDGYDVSEMLAETVRSMDQTRLVSGALCSFFKGLDNEDNMNFWKSLQEETMENGGSLVNLDSRYGKSIWKEYTGPFAKNWDVVGYNYLNYHFESTHEMYPDRVMCTTESKPGQNIEYWADVKRLPYVIGDFLWTSIDYIGEAGIGQCIYCEPDQAAQMGRMLNYAGYPWRLAHAGDFDLCGNLKPQGAFHKVVWGDPMTYIFAKNPAVYGKLELVGRYGWADGGNHWTWNSSAGSPTTVEVYSGADEVELIQDGRSLGRRPASEANRFKAVFEVNYEAGTLEAISYTDGLEVSRDMVKTAGAAAGLKITMEKECIAADGMSLAYGTVEIVDADGNYVPTAADVLARASVTLKDGQAAEEIAELAAFGTGRGQTEENYTTGTFTSYEGRWQIIVRSGQKTGQVLVRVSTEELGSAEAVIEVR